jgi:putative ABC transport system permease protein
MDRTLVGWFVIAKSEVEENMWMESLAEDVQYGIRSLVKSRRFALAAVLTLALGIGINTAMFSVVHAVLLEPWPVSDPSRVAVVSQRQQNGASNIFSTADFLDWKQQGGLTAQMGAHVAWQFNLNSAGQPPERIAGGQVSSELFPVLGVTPLLGRTFSQADDTAGAGNTVMLSYALWKTRYGGDVQIVGKPIALNGAPYTVVGVMPAGFNYFGGNEMLWTPLQLSRTNAMGASSNIHWLLGFIRLPAGVSLVKAQTELNATAARLHRENATSDAGFGVALQSLDDAFTGSVSGPLWMLMGCVGFVLLIACTNVANLLLARGNARRKEMAVRAALGASPLRIVRQLLTESLLLAMTGGALGVSVAFLVLRGLLALHPPSVPRIEDVAIDAGVLGFSLAATVVIGILFGLVPAIDAARIDPNAGLREREGTGSRGFGRQRSALVITETALACVLLIGTGLALKSLWSLRGVDLGFVPNHVQTFRVAAPAQLDGLQQTEFYQQVAERIRAIPGVESAAVARNLPMSGTDPSMPITVEGRGSGLAQGEVVSRYRAIGTDYFRTLHIPILQGRAFDEHDTANAPAVAIVTQSLAQKYWPGESALGKRLKPNFKGSVWCTVVGVAADVRHWGVDVDIEPTAYYAYTQVPDSIRHLLEADMSLAVRSSPAAGDLLHSIRAAVAGINGNVPLFDVQTMDQMVADSGSLRRFDLSLLGGFSLLALALAAIGVYGVMAYSVAMRTREIGVRMALGARASDVVGLTLMQGGRLALIGVLVGAGASILLRKVMAHLIYGLSGTDPVVLVAVPAVILVVVLLACSLPARRAAKVDPVIALRYE